MRITVVGVLAMIGAIVLLAFVADRVIQKLNRNQSGNDELPSNPS